MTNYTKLISYLESTHRHSQSVYNLKLSLRMAIDAIVELLDERDSTFAVIQQSPEERTHELLSEISGKLDILSEIAGDKS